jgi:hypothetical protein
MKVFLRYCWRHRNRYKMYYFVACFPFEAMKCTNFRLKALFTQPCVPSVVIASAAVMHSLTTDTRGSNSHPRGTGDSVLRDMRQYGAIRLGGHGPRSGARAFCFEGLQFVYMTQGTGIALTNSTLTNILDWILLRISFPRI